MYVCKECDQQFEFTRGFKLHLKRVHNTCVKDYMIKHEHSGVHPTCACGCGQEVAWRQDSYFQTLVRGHYTQELRDAQAQRRKGKKTSAQTKQRMSEASKKLFATERGKKLKEKRAENLRAFHASKDGKIWAQERSENMKEFNKTEHGKRARKQAGKKVSAWRRSNPDAMKKMGEKIKDFYKTEDGKRVLELQSKNLKHFYSTNKGKETIKRIAQKNKKSLLLNEEQFDEKINRILSVFNVEQNLPTYDNYIGYRETFDVVVNIKCKDKNHNDTRKLINIINVPTCLACSSKLTKPQLEIADYVRNLKLDVIVNDKTQISPKELDVYVPYKKFAIEFNGLYWHSELNRDDNHVVQKLSALQSKIKLLTIFEDEWRDKQDIVKSMIKSKLGLNQRLCGARQCKVVNLTKKQRCEFFDANHLDGDVRSKVAFGLEYDGEIVSVVSLRTPLHKSQDKILEIARFASKIDCNIPGALSKLFKVSREYASKNDYRKLMTYVDARVGDGSAYVKSGMKLVRQTKPRFWWTDFKVRYDRFKFRAKDNMTQAEIAKQAGVVKIWGAQNYVFEYDI